MKKYTENEFFSLPLAEMTRLHFRYRSEMDSLAYHGDCIRDRLIALRAKIGEAKLTEADRRKIYQQLDAVADMLPNTDVQFIDWALGQRVDPELWSTMERLLDEIEQALEGSPEWAIHYHDGCEFWACDKGTPMQIMRKIVVLHKQGIKVYPMDSSWYGARLGDWIAEY